ncbi:MAG: hypothetical protein HXY18_14370, partial [Bryobacteraceae bacterium]|nr:hypothetical protein [Bryobacteraceae bacterium]
MKTLIRQPAVTPKNKPQTPCAEPIVEPEQTSGQTQPPPAIRHTEKIMSPGGAPNEGFRKWSEDFAYLREAFFTMLDEDGDTELAAFLRACFDPHAPAPSQPLTFRHCQALSIVFQLLN